MALSDPINVRLGAARRQKTLMKLAQQMAARAGGRAQGAGAPFRSAIAGRGAARPTVRLPLTLPNGRPRPAGFDPFLSDNPAEWGPPPVLPGGPGAMGGGDPVADASASQYPVVAAGGWTGAVNPTTGVPMSSGFGGEAPIWLGGQSDAPLNQPMASQTAYPNPWEVIPYWPGVVRPGMPYVAV